MAVQINTMDDESYLILHHSRSLSYYLQVIAHQEKLTKQNKEVMTWNNIQWKLRMLMFDCYQISIGKIDKNISIFCNNCIGAFVAHDFRLPFNSPTVNLMIPPSDFIEYLNITPMRPSNQQNPTNHGQLLCWEVKYIYI